MVSEIAAIVEDWGNEQAERIRDNIAAKGHNANGDQFAASFVPMEVEIREDTLVWKMAGPSWYDVIDKGGMRWKGKMPPVNPIMEWLAHKGIKAGGLKKKKTIGEAIRQKKETNSLPEIAKGSWHDNKQYSMQRSMAFAIAINIKRRGVVKGFPAKSIGTGSNFYSEVMNAEAFIDLRKRIIAKTANPQFIFQFIDPDKA